MPSVEELARDVFGQRAAFYTTSATHCDPVTLGRLAELAAPRPNWRALDVATGAGHTALALAPYVAEVVGTDLTPEMLLEARRLGFSRDVPNLRWAIADVHAMPFEDCAFQLVTCRRAAHHFGRLPVALRELHRVLAPDGRLVLDDRSVPEDARVDAVMNRLDRWHDCSHVREYSPSAWRTLLEGAGFRIEHLETYVQHRPLSALTRGVAAEEVEAIQQTLADLDGSLRTAMHVEEVDGTLYLDHWYVAIAALRC
ncbi:MAG: class I SAM-dependent methyltransferase [Anaerolineae bacterium]